VSWEDGYDNWKLAYPPEYDAEREPGCWCGEGDDPCPLHGEDEPASELPARDAHGQPLRQPDLHRGDCLTCGAEDCGPRHVCPDPEYLGPALPPKPFVKRWDPVSAQWVWCMVENGKAWDFKRGAYTDVRPEEVTP
jgi:hypothetical protein